MPVSDDDLLLQRFYGHVATRGDAVYLTQPIGGGEVRTYTFAEVADQARRMATHLVGLDLPAGSKVAILSKNCAHFFMAELGIWMAGHVSVALYPTLNRATVRYILEHSESRLLFVGKLDGWDTELSHGVPDDLPCIAFPLSPKTDYPRWDDLVAEAAPIDGPPVRAADDESLIIYTSGSTGQPKGVVHTFGTISAPTASLAKTLSATADDRILSYLPLAHAMDRWLSLCLSLYTGLQIYFAESLDTFVSDLNRARPTLFVSVPRLWLKFQLGVFKKMPRKRLELLTRIPIVSGIVKRKILGNLGLDSARFAGSGSAPIPAELITWYRNLGLELLEGYGMSENFNFSHLTRPGHGRAGYIGHPHPEVECKISDAGEILIKSPGNMKGYYKQPEATAEAFTEDGWLRTGDRGTIDAEGRLRITGRVKELFKTSKGKYVAPAPIENHINNDEHIEMSMVSGSGMANTHAVVQLAEDWAAKVGDPAVKAQLTEALTALLASVNNKVEAYERLGFLVVANAPWTIEGNHLTPTQKIRRTVLEDQYQPKLEAWYASGDKVIWE
ncbi:MAG: long-chain acyl-CoA synthetase [Myxococcota bacterium]|jgi:long-chain acyl-CoA synthetase